MRDLYGRLAAIGYDSRFVRAHVLPEWWEDELATNAATRAMVELTIARMLGLDVIALSEPSAPLPPPTIGHARLKHHKGAEIGSLAPALGLAERMTWALVPELRDVPTFAGPRTAHQLRAFALATHPVVSLGALLDVSWGSGIPVFHLGELPRRAKRLDGIAMMRDYTPTIVLASGRDSPPWLAFHLAHELGHVMLEHVRRGGQPLADDDLDARGGNGLDDDGEERAADEFARELLFNDPRPKVTASPNLKPIPLAFRGVELATRDGIDPGVRALFYARASGRWGTAQRALKRLDMSQGARQMIADALHRHLPDDLSETAERFAELSGVAGSE